MSSNFHGQLFSLFTHFAAREESHSIKVKITTKKDGINEDLHFSLTRLPAFITTPPVPPNQKNF